MPTYEPRATIPASILERSFLRAYLECAEWCGIDDEQRSAFEDAADPSWSPEAIEQAKADCEGFLSLLDEDTLSVVSADMARAGHDFWLTRNHHGAGFWDGDWPAAAARKLTDWSHSFGEVNVWYNDDEETLSF